MDALYLKENINDAITEALTSMVVSVPEDPIEYLGNYLLNYVDRKTAMRMVKKEIFTNPYILKQRPFQLVLITLICH